jgi:AcrR family transcriptional regulator
MKNLSTRQREIVEASIDIISGQGIQNLTIKNLANKIGFSEPALYRHFKSKMEILLAILSGFENQIHKYKEVIDSKRDSAVSKLKAIFKNHFKNFSQNPTLASVIFAEEIFQDDKRLAQKIYSIMDYNYKLILSIITEGQSKGGVRADIKADQLVLIIMGSLRLIIKKWALSGYSFNIEKEGDKLWKSLFTLLAG